MQINSVVVSSNKMSIVTFSDCAAYTIKMFVNKIQNLIPSLTNLCVIYNYSLKIDYIQTITNTRDQIGLDMYDITYSKVTYS